MNIKLIIIFVSLLLSGCVGDLIYGPGDPKPVRNKEVAPPAGAEESADAVWAILNGPGARPRARWFEGVLVGNNGRIITGTYENNQVWLATARETGEPLSVYQSALVHELMHAVLDRTTSSADPFHFSPRWIETTSDSEARQWIKEAGY